MPQVKNKIIRRARAPPRARMCAAARTCRHAAACQQNSRLGDGVGRDAGKTPLMKHDLRSLELLDQHVVPRLLLVWLSSTSIWLGSRVPLRTWTISRRTRTNKETRSRCLRQPTGRSACSDVGKPFADEEGSCQISSSVAVSTVGMLGRLFTRRSIWKE